MRSIRLLAVAVLAVVVALSSAENAFAIQIDMHPTCGQPPPDGFTVTGVSGGWRIDLRTWGSGWGMLEIQDLDGVLKCTFSRWGTTDGFTFTITDDSSSASATYTVDCPAVGGVVEPANTFAVAAPWLAVIGLVGCIGVVGVLVKRRRP